MRTLSRKRSNRTALERNLISSLVLHGRIITTEAKAKHVTPLIERLLTKAKANNLSARRYAATVLTTDVAVAKLFNEVLPALPKEKTSGYVTIVKSMPRDGDAAPTAVLRLAAEVKKEETKVDKKKEVKK